MLIGFSPYFFQQKNKNEVSVRYLNKTPCNYSLLFHKANCKECWVQLYVISSLGKNITKYCVYSNSQEMDYCDYLVFRRVYDDSISIYDFLDDYFDYLSLFNLSIEDFKSLIVLNCTSIRYGVYKDRKKEEKSLLEFLE